MEAQKATYKEIVNAMCPICGEISSFRSNNAGAHVHYRCSNCDDFSFTYESIAGVNIGRTIEAIGKS